MAVLFMFKGSLNILIINPLSVSDMLLFTYLLILFIIPSLNRILNFIYLFWEFPSIKGRENSMTPI